MLFLMDNTLSGMGQPTFVLPTTITHYLKLYALCYIYIRISWEGLCVKTKKCVLSRTQCKYVKTFHL